MGTDIACPEGAKDRIGKGMEKNIGIGVTFEASFIGNGDAAKDEGSSRDQRMNIITKANAQHGERMSREWV